MQGSEEFDGGPRGQGGRFADPMGPSGWFDESSDES